MLPLWNFCICIYDYGILLLRAEIALWTLIKTLYTITQRVDDLFTQPAPHRSCASCITPTARLVICIFPSPSAIIWTLLLLNEPRTCHSCRHAFVHQAENRARVSFTGSIFSSIGKRTTNNESRRVRASVASVARCFWWAALLLGDSLSLSLSLSLSRSRPRRGDWPTPQVWGKGWLLGQQPSGRIPQPASRLVR